MEGLGTPGDGVCHHQEAHPARGPFERKDRAAEEPHGHEDEVHDAVEPLAGIDPPRGRQPDARDPEGGAEKGEGGEGEGGRADGVAEEEDSGEDDHRLGGRDEGRAEELAGRDRPAGGRADEDGLEESLASVLDERHCAEDGTEEDGHGEHPGEEVGAVAEGVVCGDRARGGGGRAEGVCEAAAEEEPDEERGGDGGDKTGGLAGDANQLAAGEGEGTGKA